MEGSFKLLGTANAVGMPIIGCHCSVCMSSDPLNRRTRCGALIKVAGKTILLDVGPDYYHQALKYQIHHLDGVMITHTHFDHVAGLDDLRIYAFKTGFPLPLLISSASFHDLKLRYAYLFTSSSKFAVQLLEEKAFSTTFLDIPITYFFYSQTGMQVTGYRFGDLAFVTDIKNYSEEMFSHLEGCKTLIISAISWKNSTAHLTVDEAVSFGKKVKAESIFITHIGHDLEHVATNRQLEGKAYLTYDGMELSFHI